MNELWKQEAVPTDIVYTSKLFYAVHNLCFTNYFSTNHKVLIIEVVSARQFIVTNKHFKFLIKIEPLSLKP